MPSLFSESLLRNAPAGIPVVPPAVPGSVPRPALLRRLVCAQNRLTLSFTPAGFGKSALYSECARLAPSCVRVVWLELSGLALTPAELTMRIAEALGVELDLSETKGGLYRSLGRVGQPLWLVLDDYPRDACPELDAYLEDQVERTPQCVRWWINGRRRPAWSLPRLLLQNAVLELDAQDLAFGAEELHSLLDEHDVALSLELRERLLEACQGWPALIRLLLREATAETLEERLSIGTPLLLNYLKREVVSDPDPDCAPLKALQRRHPQWFAEWSTVRASPFPVPPPSLSSLLSKRELVILQLIASGCSNREIADRLYLSVNTVKSHAWSINGKLGTERRTQAVAQAKLHGLLS